jgi:probable HAF family extracellular repeat protein
MIAYHGYSAGQATDAGMVQVPGVGIVEFSWFRPTALNNLGQVVGYDAAFDGYLITLANDGTITDEDWLGDFIPFAINDSGEMAGQQGSSAAIAWFENGVLQVQTLPGLYAGNYGRATGINNDGEVVGVSASNSTSSGSLSGYYRPFLWDSVMGLVALTTNETGAALDINDHGQVVGWSTNSTGYYAFLWENGTLSDLNALSGVGTKTFRLGSAESINNAGHIVGRSDSYNKNGTSAGNGSYLLTPTP